MYDAAVDSFGFVSRKYQDWFLDNQEMICGILEEKKKLLDRILSCPANFPEKKELEIDFNNYKARVQRKMHTAKN